MVRSLLVWIARVALLGFLLLTACWQLSAQGLGRSTYFAWRSGTAESVWLVITSYEPGNPRHDTATLVRPDHDHDLCVETPGSDLVPAEVACVTTADVAAGILAGHRW
jgi:hypothetical protein